MNCVTYRDAQVKNFRALFNMVAADSFSWSFLTQISINHDSVVLCPSTNIHVQEITVRHLQCLFYMHVTTVPFYFDKLKQLNIVVVLQDFAHITIYFIIKAYQLLIFICCGAVGHGLYCTIRHEQS